MVEREVAQLAALSEQRTQEGAAGKNTRSLAKRMTSSRKKIKDLMSTWQAVHALGVAGAELPQFDESNIFANNLPWQASLNMQHPNQQQLQLQLYKLESELKRCHEELRYLPTDAMRVLAYYQNQIRQMQQWLLLHDADQYAQTGRVMLMYDQLQRMERVKAAAITTFEKCGWCISMM